MLDSSHQLSLKLMQNCPSCRCAITQRNVVILTESEESIIAHTQCPKCNAKFITRITGSPQGITGNAILTDLNAHEARTLLTQRPITDDDFLDMYRIISDKQFIDNLTIKFNNINRKDI